MDNAYKDLKSQIWKLGAYLFLNSTKKIIRLAKNAGFCYGVKRAVDLSIKIKKENPDEQVYILGQLIHNNQVIDQLNSLGIKTIDEIPDKIDGTCIIRTHGATPQTITELKAKGCKIIDATCPDVKRVQDKAQDLSKEGYQVIIIGKADHPEVIGIKAYADLNAENEAIVISSKEEGLKSISCPITEPFFALTVWKSPPSHIRTILLVLISAIIAFILSPPVNELL